MSNTEKIANEADVIINGYAFLKSDDGIKAINLNNDYDTAVFKTDGTLIETNMDDIELTIAKDYLPNAQKYMEK